MARVQLDLSAREVARLNHIMELCDLTTRKDLFNNAFTALEWMAKETRAGRTVYSAAEQSDDRYILNLPALQNVEVRDVQAAADHNSGSEQKRARAKTAQSAVGPLKAAG